MQRILTRSLIFFFLFATHLFCTLVNSAPRCLAAHGLAAAPEESIGMRSSVSSASIFASAWVAEEARAPGSRGNRQTLSELAASNPAAPPPPRAANRLSASGRVCGRNDTPRQREARRPRLAAMTVTARKRYHWAGAGKYYAQKCAPRSHRANTAGYSVLWELRPWLQAALYRRKEWPESPMVG